MHKLKFISLLFVTVATGIVLLAIIYLVNLRQNPLVIGFSQSKVINLEKHDKKNILGNYELFSAESKLYLLDRTTKILKEYGATYNEKENIDLSYIPDDILFIGFYNEELMISQTLKFDNELNIVSNKLNLVDLKNKRITLTKDFELESILFYTDGSYVWSNGKLYSINKDDLSTIEIGSFDNTNIKFTDQGFSLYKSKTDSVLEKEEYKVKNDKANMVRSFDCYLFDSSLSQNQSYRYSLCGEASTRLFESTLINAITSNSLTVIGRNTSFEYEIDGNLVIQNSVSNKELITFDDKLLAIVEGNDAVHVIEIEPEIDKFNLAYLNPF